MEEKCSYKKFKDLVLCYVKRKFDTDVNIEIHNVVKNNSFELEGMVIIENGKNISPNFYLQLYYQEYLHGTCIEDIVAQMLKRYEELQYEDFSNFSMDIESCMDKIVCRLVSYEKNSKLLEDIPHIRFLDLAIIFYCLVTENKDGIGSIRISNKIMENWNMTVKMLYQVAIYNTERLFPKVFCSLQSMLESMLVSGTKEMSEAFYDAYDYNLQDVKAPFILTNRRGINGAAVMLYPDCLKEIGKMAGDDLYIIPSSIHELIIVPDYIQTHPKELRRMVKEVNTSCVAAEEVLSDMIYKYSVEKNVIEICN